MFVSFMGFTGTLDNQKGLPEKAAGSTIILDEISEKPLSSQPKLLHVLEPETIRRVGNDRNNTLNCRALITTNCNLMEQVNLGNFGQDLYYRIAVYKITLPLLRERLADSALTKFHSPWIMRTTRENFGLSLNDE